MITTIWAYFRLAETKDRTFEELDILFEKGVPARQFAKYKLDNNTQEIHEIEAERKASKV